MSASSAPTTSPLVVDDAFARVHMLFVRRVARRMGVPEADLDDVVQETMLAAVTNAHTFEAGRHERAWLFGIARNCARRVYRRAREVAFAEPPEQAVSGGQQRAVAERQARSLVHRALDELPEAQRDVVVLHALEGWAMPRVAEALGCSEPTAHSRYRLARARIGRTIRGRTVRAQLAAAVASVLAFFSLPAPAAAATVVLLAVVGVSAWATTAARHEGGEPARAPSVARMTESAPRPAADVGLETAEHARLAEGRSAVEAPPAASPARRAGPGRGHPSASLPVLAEQGTPAASAAPTVASPVQGSTPASEPPPVPASPSQNELASLALEGALLRRARAERATDPERARATLREYRTRFPAGRLGREADQLEASLPSRQRRE